MNISLKTIGERLRQYLIYKKVGVNQLGKMAHSSGAQISNILNGKNYGIIKLLEVLQACPDLRITWLLKGEGSMIIDSLEESAASALPQEATNEDLLRKLHGLIEENNALKSQLEKFEQKNTSLEGGLVYQSMAIDAYKRTLEVLSATNYDMKNLIEHYKALSNKESSSVKSA